jgi:Tat protein translocase TatB subunit
MPQIGPLEIFMVAAIGLIVFGPQKLPEIARNIGRALSTLKKMATEVKEEFESELAVDEDERIRPETERPDPVRLTPEAVQPTDKDEVLKPGEPGPGDEVDGGDEVDPIGDDHE